MKTRSPHHHTLRLPLAMLLPLCLAAIPGGLQSQTPPPRKPLFQSVKSWWDRVRAPKAGYDHNPYAYTDPKQPVRIDPPEWQPVAPIQYDWRERTYQFSKHLDKLNKQVEEWGTIQMAPLVLAPARHFANGTEDYPFALDTASTAPTEPPKPGAPAAADKPDPLGLRGQYAEYAKSQGGSFSIVREQFRGAADIKLDATGASAAPLIVPDPQGKPPATSVGATLPTLGDGASNQLVGTTKVDVSTATFSPHSRMVAAADTTQVKNILTLMGRPEAALEYKDRKILYGVTNISVNPGWRTKTDYVAHIDAAATITYRKASREMIAKLIRWKQLPFEARQVIAQAHWQHLTAEERAAFGPFSYSAQSSVTVPATCTGYFPPLAEHDHMDTQGRQQPDGVYDEDLNARIAINVVTPLMDTQNLALGSSSARQTELAFQIASLLGPTNAGSASAFANWARLNRRDTVTMSTLAVANAYSMGDSYFGFEVGNRLRGMASPEADDGKAGMVLERQTFPALLMLGMHEDQARPRLVRNARNEPEVWMPELYVSYNTRWSRHTRGWLWGAFDRNRKFSESYKARNDLARASAAMHSPMDPLKDHVNPWLNEQDDLFLTQKNLVRDHQVLTGSYFGSVIHTPLPAEFLVADQDVETTLQGPASQLVRATDLAVYPSDKTLTSTAAKASTASEILHMVITGKNLDQVELSGITLQGDALQTLDLAPDPPRPPVLLGPTAISLHVRVRAGTDEEARPVGDPPTKLQTPTRYFQFELPIKAGSPVLEMMKEKSVFTQRCGYRFELPPPAAKPDKKPVLASLVREQITGTGKVDNNKLQGSIDVMLKGSGLQSWKQDNLEITVNPSGRGTYKKDSLNVLGDAGLFLTLNVEGEGPQAAFITFKMKNADGTPGETFHSPAFEYTLIKK